jgi:SAM-dependent methyltransferase
VDTDRLWRQSDIAVANFGEKAQAYHRYRPGYPAELFSDVARVCRLDGAGVVVDVGAGTGISSLGFAPLCSTLVCLEPSAEMASIAQVTLAHSPGVTVVRSSFERWEPTVADVNLVASANAWHWVDPDVRWSKAAELLAPDGYLALLWHDLVGYSPANFAQRLAEVGGALNPALAAKPTDLGIDAQDTWAERIGASGFFSGVESTRYRFSRPLDAESFVAVLNTYGVNDALSSAERQRLDRVLVELVNDEFDGEVHKHEDAVLHLAQRS